MDLNILSKNTQNNILLGSLRELLNTEPDTKLCNFKLVLDILKDDYGMTDDDIYKYIPKEYLYNEIIHEDDEIDNEFELKYTMDNYLKLLALCIIKNNKFDKRFSLNIDEIFIDIKKIHISSDLYPIISDLSKMTWSSTYFAYQFITIYCLKLQYDYKVEELTDEELFRLSDISQAIVYTIRNL